ncbi:uncharacterized protein LOC110364013 isoform X3 [Columba livia]|uniref:uncharacterized protein LOC110364013 isoform X3 n=1 Tax=Columba livia TaxID=8932 RepID=UPI0031BA5533
MGGKEKVAAYFLFSSSLQTFESVKGGWSPRSRPLLLPGAGSRGQFVAGERAEEKPPPVARRLQSLQGEHQPTNHPPTQTTGSPRLASQTPAPRHIRLRLLLKRWSSNLVK